MHASIELLALSMNLADFAKHKLIGTALGDFLVRDKLRRESRRLSGHPNLEELANESRGFELAMARILSPKSHCVDVGAHLGSVLHVIQTLAPEGAHIAIEPIGYKARWLSTKFPNVEVHELAVSDHEGEADFFVHRRQSGYSGLRLHEQAPHTASVERTRVRLTTLDALIPKDRQVGFIKIDVEGAELAALRGARALLERCRPYVEFECTRTALAAYEIDARDVFAFFESAGYDIFTVRSWLGDEQPLTSSEFLAAMTFPFRAFNFLAAPTAAAVQA